MLCIDCPDLESEQDEFISLKFIDCRNEDEILYSQLAESSEVNDRRGNEQIQCTSSVTGESEMNLGFLIERCDGDMEMVHEILSAFCSQGGECCTKMVRSLAEGNIEEVRFQAVRIQIKRFDDGASN